MGCCEAPDAGRSSRRSPRRRRGCRGGTCGTSRRPPSDAGPARSSGGSWGRGRRGAGAGREAAPSAVGGIPRVRAKQEKHARLMKGNTTRALALTTNKISLPSLSRFKGATRCVLSDYLDHGALCRRSHSPLGSFRPSSRPRWATTRSSGLAPLASGSAARPCPRARFRGARW